MTTSDTEIPLASKAPGIKTRIAFGLAAGTAIGLAVFAAGPLISSAMGLSLGTGAGYSYTFSLAAAAMIWMYSYMRDLEGAKHAGANAATIATALVPVGMFARAMTLA